MAAPDQLPVEFMRRRGSGADDMSGDFSLTGGL